MAENLTKRPAKGILKNSSSFEHVESNKNAPSDIKWDEMNILQTLHPPDKDYGHMKIEEPKTPYSYYHDDMEVSLHSEDMIDASLLAEKISLKSEEAPKSLGEGDEEDEEESEEEELGEEEKAQRKAFEIKRKRHYDEYYAVKLARNLMAKDDDDDEDEEMDGTADKV